MQTSSTTPAHPHTFADSVRRELEGMCNVGEIDHHTRRRATAVARMHKFEGPLSVSEAADLCVSLARCIDEAQSA